MDLSYTYEKTYTGGYQVRLLGEFIGSVNSKDDQAVDQILKENGYVSRQDFINQRTRDWFDVNDF